MSEALFLRLLSVEDKAEALARAVAATRQGTALDTVIHLVDPDEFEQVPGSPFAYWVSERIRHLFAVLQPFESENREVRLGDHPSDDFRYLRLFWEVPADSSSHDWRCYSKGGSYSPYYADVHLLVDWDASRQTYRDFYGRPGRASERPSNYQYFFRPSLTWPRRTTSGMSVRIQPAGCVFSDKAPSAFVDEIPTWLGLLQSAAFSALAGIQLAAADAAARSYEVGIIQQTPVPSLSRSQRIQLSELALHCVDLKRTVDTANEVSHLFQIPSLLQTKGDVLVRRADSWQLRITETHQQLAEYQRNIDDIAFRLYGIEGEDRQAIEAKVGSTRALAGDEEDEMERWEESEQEPSTTDHRHMTADLLSYFVGCAFGRWDVRYATGERSAAELPEPFGPLPVCALGELTGADGLPLRKSPPSYPLRVDWEGLLVDDPDHNDDIVRRVRDVFELIWQKRAEEIEREACELLGVKTLCDYFRKLAAVGFWTDHIKRYSKSRRKAPIYWYLRSSKGNYAIWLYYHRLDKDVLFKALLNYVEPKLRLEENNLAQLKQRREVVGTTGREGKQLERDLDKQESFLSELYDFRDKLKRAADLNLEPDLNDGVVLNIAPLWELVPWKEAEKYWKELIAGKYEWSSIGKQLRERGLVKQ